MSSLLFNYMCVMSICLTGAGNFGSVMRGIYKRGGQRIPVAIKTLKQDDVPNAEVIFPRSFHMKCVTPPYMWRPLPTLFQACLHRAFWLFAFVCKLRIYRYVCILMLLFLKKVGFLDVHIKLRSHVTSAFAFSRMKSLIKSDYSCLTFARSR